MNPTGPDPKASDSETLHHLGDAEATATASVSRPSIVEGPGTAIGPYKLLQQIGEGGMGVVFMAEQERPVRRKVALKVIKPGMDTNQVIARFEAERQALAMMDHPHIARVLDVGATDTGRPYFVMELVKGVPITEYCDRNHLTPKERLELFIPICQAIQHAHQKGIIHRDIKPSNVLVTLLDGRPVPKVIDFGVAKAVDQRLTEKTMFTEFGAVIGTLEYMSPEQAEMGALDIDTRSDIYSLGVMLYELLTGSTPLERAKLRKAAYVEILRRIREEEPTKPSTRLSESKDALASISAQRKMEPARLTRLVRGDLDWIVMKSLEKDRTRRYETATGFARDIQRYLDGDAVEACPPSASYKLKKFARKHRAALATAGAFALLLVAATGISAGLAYRANRERMRAEAAEKVAKEQQGRAQEREQMAIDAVKRFGEVIRETPELKNDPALAPLRAKLLKEPQAFFRRLRDQLQADRETTPASLARLAKASYDLGQLTNEIGETQEALRACEESLAIRDRLARENPSVTEFQADLVASHYEFGYMLSETGRTADALASYEQARDIQRRLARENPSIIDFQGGLAASHNSIGNLLSRTGRTADALASYEQARDIQRRLARENPADTKFQNHLAASHYNIGILLNDTGRPADALASYEQARDIQQRLARENPADTKFQNHLAASLHNIGDLLSETGRTADALASFEQAREIRQRLARENPSVTEFQAGLAKIHSGIGSLLRRTGRPTDSLASYEQAREIQRRLAGENPSVTDFQARLAYSHNGIGILLNETGKSADALASHERALDIRRRLARENPTVTEFQAALAVSHNNIGNLLSRTGRPADALASYEQAREIQRRLARENPTVTKFQADLAHSHNNIGLLLCETGRTADALASYEQAREIQQRLTRENPTVTKFQADLAYSHHNIGVLLDKTGRPADALASFEQARDIRQRLARENPSIIDFQGGLAASHNSIGILLSRTGRTADALASYEQAREIQRRLARENPSVTEFLADLAHSHNNIGILLRWTGRPADALASYEQAREIRQRLARDNPESPDFAGDLGKTWDDMAVIDLDAKRYEDARSKLMLAIEAQRRALSSNPDHPAYRQFLIGHLNNLILATESLGRTDEANQARREQAELDASDPAKLALDARLAAVLGGQQAPRDEAERIQLALHAYGRSRHAASARLYTEAFALNPKLAEDREAQHPYNAACAAALAGSGQGKDDPSPDEAARVKLRRQALDWLRAELVTWGKILDGGPAELKAKVGPTLQHWKDDSDLLGLREERELAKLPEEERAGFQQLWSDVDRLLAKALGHP